MTVGVVLKAYPRLSESFILNELRLLERRGMELTIFALKPTNEPDATEAARHIDAPVRYLPEHPDAGDARLGIWLRRNLWRYLKTHGPVLRRAPGRYLGALFFAIIGIGLQVGVDGRSSFKRAAIKDFLRAATVASWMTDDVRHLHAHFCHGATTMAMLAAHMSGRTYSFTAHAKDIYVPKLNPGGLLGSKIKRAAFVATCTGANREHLATLRPKERHRIHAIHHGLDIHAFSPPHERAKEPERAVVMSVGRHVPKKGFDDLLRAVAMLRADGADFELRLVGAQGPETPLLERMIHALDLNRTVTLVDPMPAAQLAAAYREADLFVLACRVADDGDRDGIPNVLAEAMATGVPVVATDISGIPELVDDGRTGLLVRQNDPEALARAMGRLIGDAALRHEIGCAARRHIVEHFDASRTIDDLVALFEEVDPNHRHDLGRVELMEVAS